MKRILLLGFFLLAGCAAGSRWKGYKPFNDPGNHPHTERISTYDVQRYTLWISFDPKERTVTGRENIDLTVLEDASSITLDAADMTLTTVALRRGTSLSPVPVSDGDWKFVTQPLTFAHRGEKLKIEFGKTVRREESLTLRLEWTGRPTRGFHFVGPDEGYPQKPAQVWTQGETEYNHFWFPCYDDPNDKAQSTVTVRVPKGWFAVSNGELVSQIEEDDGTIFRWCEDIPHASYLTSVIAGEFDSYEDRVTLGDRTVPVQYFVPKGLFSAEDVRRSFADTPNMIRFYSEKTGIPYPYKKYAQSLAVDFNWGGMENITATTLTWLGVVYPSAAQPDWSSEGLIAHELAHQWFGDLVTCRTWEHIWLNESFASYFDALWTEHQYGVDEMMLDLLHGAEWYFEQSKEYQRPIVTNLYTEPDDVFDSHAYPKGAYVLHMLRDLVGTEKWWKGIHLYLRIHAEKTATTKDFQKAIEEASGQDLDWFFDQWLYKAGHPEFEVKSEWDEAYKTLKLIVRQTQKVDEHRPIFRVPISIEIEGKTYRIWSNQLCQEYYFPLDSKPLLVAFDPKGTILKTLKFEKTAEKLMYQLHYGTTAVARRWAAGQLEERGEKEAVPALKKALLQDGFHGVRSVCARSLGKRKSEEAVQALVEAYGGEKDSRVRSALMKALGECTSVEAAKQALVRALAEDPSWKVKESAAAALGHFGKDAYDILLKAWETHRENHFVAPGIVGGLANTKDERATRFLIERTAYGEHPWIRQRAGGALKSIAKDHPEGVARLVELTRDPVYRFRAAAVEALGELGDRSALPTLEKLLKTETDGRQRKTLREAIDRIKKTR